MKTYSKQVHKTDSFFLFFHFLSTLCEPQKSGLFYFLIFVL